MINAVIDPSGGGMNFIEKATGNVGAILFDMDNRLPSPPRSRSMDAAFDAYVSGGWHQRDERYRLTSLQMRNGVTTEFGLFTPEQIAGSAYCQEFLAPLGLRWYAAIKMAAGDEFWALSLQRSIAQGPYSPAEVRQLRRLSDTLCSVAAFSRAIGACRMDAALDAFSVSGVAVLMLERRGNVISANTAAEELFDVDVQLRRGRFVPRDRVAAETLERSLNALLLDGESAASQPPVVLPRSDGRPLLVYAMRLSGVSADIFSRCQALLVLVDTEVCPQPAEDVLRTCFGLTAVEARLARRLVETASQRACITRETARNQLKAIFAKTDTDRQAELSLLLARLGRSVARS